mgnify:CR=1 FL=1
MNTSLKNESLQTLSLRTASTVVICLPCAALIGVEQELISVAVIC